MIAKIGWKNVWRKKGRSLIVIMSVAIGVWAGLFFGGFQWGSYVQKLDDIVNRELGHAQIHAKDFIEEEYDYNFPIKNPEEVRAILDADTLIKSYVERSVFSGMVSTARDQSLALVFGVDTLQEQSISSISSMIVEGEMVQGKRAPSLLIGKAMAEQLNLKIGSKLNVQGGLLHGVKSFVGKVRGIYESPNKLKDKVVIYVHKSDIEKKLGDGFVHEYAIIFKEFDSLEAQTAFLKSQLTDLDVLSWGALMPEIKEGIAITDAVMSVIMIIIWFALALGIINTMLMSVLERTNELGMLMAIGMSRYKIASMIFFETAVLTVVGVPVGLLLTMISMSYYGEVGIDLSFADSAISEFGFESIIYPKIKPNFYYQVIYQVIIVSLISTVFPVMRVLKLRPVEAIRKS
jgi:ABC-type lipoprotein release transport system permease subunit